MKQFLISIVTAVALICSLASCGSKEKKGTNKWLHDDDVNVCIDETFRPIMDNLVQSFGMAHPEANMKATYVSEDSALRLLVLDSVRCAIATRKLTDKEKKYIESHQLSATQSMFASDAIALIVNKNNPDTIISVDEIKNIVSGKITRWEQLKGSNGKKGELSIVFDNSGSSTVRYMRDSLCAGHDLKGNVYASKGKTNKSVIEMVEADPDIIGIVGANWLMGDSGNASADFSNLPFGVLRVTRNWNGSYRPYQYYIGTAAYPLLRSVYIMHTDPRSQSMLKNFFFFTKGQKGQTIICNNSQMLPITPVMVKDVKTK